MDSLQSAEGSALSAVSVCVLVKRNDVKANIWIVLLDRLRSMKQQRDECSRIAMDPSDQPGRGKIFQ